MEVWKGDDFELWVGFEDGFECVECSVEGPSAWGSDNAGYGLDIFNLGREMMALSLAFRGEERIADGVRFGAEVVIALCVADEVEVFWRHTRYLKRTGYQEL